MEKTYNYNTISKEEFDELMIDLMGSFFHVYSDDIDDEAGCKIEERILVEFLAENPKILSVKPLEYFVEQFVGTGPYKEDKK